MGEWLAKYWLEVAFGLIVTGFGIVLKKFGTKLKEEKARSQAIESGEPTVNIGDIEGNPDVALVTATIKVGEDSENTITLVGPKRMDYDKAMSALEYLAQELEKYFNDKGGNDA